MNKILEEVLTTKEASEIYPVADCTIRAWILNNEFNKTEFRKSGNTWLITKKGLEDILKKKNIINSLDEKKLLMNAKKIKIIFASKKTFQFILEMPYKDLLLNILEIYNKKHSLNIKTIVVSDDWQVSNNSLNTKTKIWYLSAKSMYDILLNGLVYKKVDTEELISYYNCKITEGK